MPHSGRLQRVMEMLRSTFLEVLIVKVKYRKGAEQIKKIEKKRAGQLKANGDLDEVVKKIINGGQYKTQLIKYLRENGGKKEANLLN